MKTPLVTLLLIGAMLCGCEQLLPRPNPAPAPLPPIVVPVGDVWCIILEETSTRTPALAELICDNGYWQRLAARGIHVRAYDLDSPDAAKYVSATSAVSRPTLLLLDKTGRQIKAIALPKDAAGVDAALKGVGK